MEWATPKAHLPASDNQGLVRPTTLQVGLEIPSQGAWRNAPQAQPAHETWVGLISQPLRSPENQQRKILGRQDSS